MGREPEYELGNIGMGTVELEMEAEEGGRTADWGCRLGALDLCAVTERMATYALNKHCAQS